MTRRVSGEAFATAAEIASASVRVSLSDRNIFRKLQHLQSRAGYPLRFAKDDPARVRRSFCNRGRDRFGVRTGQSFRSEHFPKIAAPAIPSRVSAEVRQG